MAPGSSSWLSTVTVVSTLRMLATMSLVPVNPRIIAGVTDDVAAARANLRSVVDDVVAAPSYADAAAAEPELWAAWNGTAHAAARAATKLRGACNFARA